MPENVQDLNAPVSNQQLYALLQKVSTQPHVTVTQEGTSMKGKPIHLVRLHRSENPTWRVFFYGQQHGNETSGKDALAYLIRDYAQNPEKLPLDVDLYILPLVNPDGAADYARRNAADADLNRDHILFNQPETRILHKVGRRIQPHVAVDGHEFKRDTSDYTERGWKEWPVIMMGTANSPLYNPTLFEMGKRWVDRVGVTMDKQGFNYERYFLAYYPPHGEFRYSTLEADDGRNSFGLYYHALSFIIESGVYREILEDPFSDIAERTQAYLGIFNQFVQDIEYREEELAAVEAARKAPVIPYIATNFFWGSDGDFNHPSRAVDIETGETVVFNVPNFMKHRVVKRYVETPEGYLIAKKHVSLIKPLLDRHELDYEILKSAQTLNVETCHLQRIETEYDELYERYEGRQIVSCEAADEKTFQPGSLSITLTAPRANEVIVMLEPQMLYGLFQYPEFASLADESKEIGVYRLMP
ncbi:MAG: M14 family zinc carboxypeptidase [Aestuariibacter sp.]